jgi:alpha-L-arabinofuranosidase
MQRRPGDFALASRTLLYSYLIGLVGIGRDRAVLSPPALALEMYSTRDTSHAVRATVEGPTFDVPPAGLFLGAKGARVLDVSARKNVRHADLFVLNRDLENDSNAEIQLSGTIGGGDVEVALLTAPSLRDWNSFDQPDRVKVTRSRTASARNFTWTFPAHSLTRFRIPLAP